MGPIQINFVIFMLGAAIVMIVWFRSSQAAVSARRMMGMMTRVGLDPGSAMFGDAQTMATRNEVRRRCKRCSREDFCDRWLAGKVEGNNAFCPNAQTFRTLTGASGRTD